ncbi:Ecto-NOX disulfide-thiol exchanger 1 [Bienertia sinuspersici]
MHKLWFKADLVTSENVLKVFFVPVWKWPAKKPLLHCNNCNLFFPESLSLPPSTTSSSSPDFDVLRCHGCSRVVEPEYRFCPFAVFPCKMFKGLFGYESL